MVTKLKRLIEPPQVAAIRYLRNHTPIRVGNRPTVLYEVGDFFKIRSAEAQFQSGATVGLSTDTPDFMAVACKLVKNDSYMLPFMEPLVCFPPGRGSYAGGSIRVSVIFWDGDFWCPVLAVEPERQALFELVYGELDDWELDVLYKVEASEVPSIIDSIGEIYDDPAQAPGWTSRLGFNTQGGFATLGYTSFTGHLLGDCNGENQYD